MPSNRYPLIAREGWFLLAVLIILGIILVSEYSLIKSVPVWLLVVLLIYFFRDPHRVIPSSPLAVVSPIDGIVEEINPVTDNWLERPSLRVRIRTDYQSTFSVRCPLEGKLVKNWFSEPASLGNDSRIYQNSFWIKSDEKDDVVTAIYVSKVSSRLRFYAEPGMRIGQGQRCGYLYLGGGVEVYLPNDTNITVSVGDRVLSGSGVLGKLNTHQPPVTQYAHS